LYYSIYLFCSSSIHKYYLLIATDVTIVDTPSINAKIIPPTIAFLKATLAPPTHNQYISDDINTSDGEHSSSDEASSYGVIWVILLSVINKQAVH